MKKNYEIIIYNIIRKKKYIYIYIYIEGVQSHKQYHGNTHKTEIMQ